MNHFEDFGFLVDTGIIHDNHGVWQWKGLHMIEQVRDKFLESKCCERSFNNLRENDTVQAQCGEQRVAKKRSYM